MGQDEQRILDYKLFVTVSSPPPPLFTRRVDRSEFDRVGRLHIIVSRVHLGRGGLFIDLKGRDEYHRWSAWQSFRTTLSLTLVASSWMTHAYNTWAFRTLPEPRTCVSSPKDACR